MKIAKATAFFAAVLLVSLSVTAGAADRLVLGEFITNTS
jgi:hypothetical protein